ncbi:hypothetical protein, partial [Mesorhizobium sp.]|uniref:hypothetical protein n=1 Tax=Mesorhizobium sp. TaxID=1871066 RepID=UPI0025FAFFCA
VLRLALAELRLIDRVEVKPRRLSSAACERERHGSDNEEPDHRLHSRVTTETCLYDAGVPIWFLSQRRRENH